MIEPTEPGTSRDVEKRTDEGFLPLLKKGTLHRHIALETTLLSRDLMSSDLTQTEYISILYGFYGAFHPLEQALDSVDETMRRHLMPIRRTPLAEKDIRYLTGTFDPAQLSKSLPLPWSSVNMPEMLGIAYVLEGSRLGGKVIGRHLHATLGITPETGGAFFAGHDSPGLKGWKTFKKYCADYAEQHPDQQEEIIRAANEAFRYVEKSFAASYTKAVS